MNNDIHYGQTHDTYLAHLAEDFLGDDYYPTGEPAEVEPETFVQTIPQHGAERINIRMQPDGWYLLTVTGHGVHSLFRTRAEAQQLGERITAEIQ